MRGDRLQAARQSLLANDFARALTLCDMLACLDPTDANVFWTINAYAAGRTTLATQITQLLTSPSPRLTVANAGRNLLLSWPVTAVPFHLEWAPSVAGAGAWSRVTQAATTNGTTVSVTVPATNSSAFFCLQ